MEPEFITYQKFNDAALADELTAVLDTHGIKYLTEQQSSGFDPSLVMNNEVIYYAVKIKSEDFERVNQLVREHEEGFVDEAGKDHYLYSFTNDELMEVVTKADEWSAFDVVLAQKILTEKGIAITDAEISDIHQKRIEDLKIPEKSETLWLIIGYICALLGGVLGIFIGWYLATGKKNLPNGEKVYIYAEGDRKQGRIIFFVGIIVFILTIILKFYTAFR